MTKKRRYLISAAVLVACVCIAIGVLAMLPPKPGVTKANFDRIEKGMTKPEVENIFGQATTMMPWADPPLAALHDAVNCICWVDDSDGKKLDRAAYVFFDKTGRVVHAQWDVEQTSVLDKIRRWLHLD